MENSVQYRQSMSDPAYLVLIGNYIRKSRLDQNKTQQELADIAGLNRSTVVQTEQGKGGTLLSLIQLLRALGRLDTLLTFDVPKEISPMLLAEMEMKSRKRAAKSSNKQAKPKSTW